LHIWWKFLKKIHIFWNQCTTRSYSYICPKMFIFLKFGTCTKKWQFWSVFVENVVKYLLGLKIKFGRILGLTFFYVNCIDTIMLCCFDFMLFILYDIDRRICRHFIPTLVLMWSQPGSLMFLVINFDGCLNLWSNSTFKTMNLLN